MIIGLAGPARSGKDTMADMIKNSEADAMQYNLADPLKACVNDWLSWGYQHGYGDQKETPQALQPNFPALVGYIIKYFGAHCTAEQAVKVMEQMREEFEIHRHVRYHNMREVFGTAVKEDAKDFFIVSPRQVYQWFGTEGMRQHVDDNIWLKLIPEGSKVILADIRFENEAAYVRENGGVIVHITRKDAQEVTAHSSEVGLAIDKGVDYNISNNGNLDDFDEEVCKFLNIYFPQQK